MPPVLTALYEQAAVVAVLMVILYAGHRGWWYWSPGVRLILAEIKRDRDDWRILAVTLLRKQGVDLPAGFERSETILLPGEEPPPDRVVVRR